MDLSELKQQLSGIVGRDHLLDDAGTLELYSQDVWQAGETVAAVARPANNGELSALVKSCTDNGVAVVGRGGGMSYTRGYTQQRSDVVVLCTRRMNRVLEINPRDMTVTVEAGCTWSDLYEALHTQGLRTPFWGPLSGRYATVGGSVSQNSIFWGGSRYGCAADSVVSMEVVLASGEILQTGSAARDTASPFFRHFGPDLTGLFSCDCGALGIKASLTLRLLPDACAREFLSFDFPDQESLLETMAEVSRADLASECFGFDPLLTEVRAQRDSLMSDAGQLVGVLKNASSLGQAASDALGIIAGGRRFMKGLGFPMHVIIEERDAATASAVAKQVQDMATARGGTSVPNSIPKIMRNNPFGPVNNMVGPGGERWAPVHGLLPLSRAAEAAGRVQQLFDDHSEALEAQGVRTGFLYNSAAGACIAVEPLFFWPDTLEAIHRDSVEPEFYRRVPKLEANLEARALVIELRQAVADLFYEMGASHLQLGRSYRYLDALQPAAAELMRAVKRSVDPHNLVNPGVLGFETDD